jgi:hypothetical protein
MRGEESGLGFIPELQVELSSTTNSHKYVHRHEHVFFPVMSWMKILCDSAKTFISQLSLRFSLRPYDT